MFEYDKFSESICFDCLKRCEMFDSLTDEEMGYLNKNRYEARFKAGEVIFKQGSPLSHIVSFSKGLAKLYMETTNHRDLIINIVQPGSIIGGPSLFYNRRHQYSFTALIDSMVCFIDIAAFQELLKSNQKFSEAFLFDLSRRQYQLTDRLMNVTIKQSHGRLAEVLLHLSDVVFNNDKFDITLSRQELADFTGMSKEGTIRILKEFKTDGLIDFQNQTFHIIDKKRLMEVSLNG